MVETRIERSMKLNIRDIKKKVSKNVKLSQEEKGRWEHVEDSGDCYQREFATNVLFGGGV